MHRPSTLTALATALVLSAASTTAKAENPNDMSFSGNFKMDYIDKNKDKMVSKAEFMETMNKVWDMKMKQMKVKGDTLDARQMEEILTYFRLGA